LLVTNYFKQL